MEVILTHKTTDGTTYHEIDIINKKHKVTTLETNTTDEFTSTKKWGSQHKFVEKLINKEINTLEGKILTQKRTIADCHYYKSEGNLDITKRRLQENRERLEFLTDYDVI